MYSTISFCPYKISLLKTGLPLIGNALRPLPKSLLIPSGLTTAAAATDAAFYV